MPRKICGASAPPYGAVDFKKSCDEPRAEKLLPLGIPVTFRRCSGCGFLFTECFDDWADQEFKEFIYNDDYIKLDPDYAEKRPRSQASMIIGQFHRDRMILRMPDYGGGGLLTRRLPESGLYRCSILRSLHVRIFSAGRLDVIARFETMEHLTDPLAAIDAMVGMLSDIGVVLFSTLLLSLGMSWPLLLSSRLTYLTDRTRTRRPGT